MFKKNHIAASIAVGNLSNHLNNTPQAFPDDDEQDETIRRLQAVIDDGQSTAGEVATAREFLDKLKAVH